MYWYASIYWALNKLKCLNILFASIYWSISIRSASIYWSTSFYWSTQCIEAYQYVANYLFLQRTLTAHVFSRHGKATLLEGVSVGPPDCQFNDFSSRPTRSDLWGVSTASFKVFFSLFRVWCCFWYHKVQNFFFYYLELDVVLVITRFKVLFHYLELDVVLVSTRFKVFFYHLELDVVLVITRS